MATDIDSLEIKINAESQKANDAIDRLVGKIDRLTTSLSKIDGSKLSSLAYGVQKLGTSMQNMNNVKTADFTRLAKNLGKLNEVDVSQLGEVAKKVDAIGQSLSGLSNVSDGAKQLGELANGIKQLGYKSSEKAITNIPQLAKAMKQLMVELSKAPKVSQNLIDMTNALAKLARTGASSGKAATSLSNAFNTYSKSTVKAKTHTFSLASAIGKLYASYWGLFRAFGKIRDAINISSDLTEVQNVVDVTFGKYANLVEKMSETSITDFGMSELTVKEVSSRFQSMGTAMGFAQGKMADMSVELTKLTADMASFYNVEQKDVAEDLESIFTGQTRPLRTYGLDLTEATLKEWALKQGLDANIDSMSQAQKTMLRYQYVLANTGAAQGDFARTSDTWANQTRILKQNLEQLATVLGGTLINALKPLVKAFNVVIGQVVTFAKVISNALGKIFGWTYEESGVGGVASDFESASDSANDIASSTGKAADNIKKMKAGLRAFDELNVINISDSGSSSGGSGGSSGSGASSGTGGQWTQTESIIKNFESEINTLYELGSKISETLINTMKSIEWDSVYEKARGFGSGLAEFLNGIFAGQNGITLFGAVGKTIAGALNAVIQSALSFGQTFDFEQFGVNIADGINRFFETFNFEDLANTLNKWVDGLEDAIGGFLKTLNWTDIIAKTGKFLGDLELDTVGVIIGGFVFKKEIKDMFKKAILKEVGTVKISLKELMIKGINAIKFNPAIVSQVFTTLTSFLTGGNGIGTASFDLIVGNLLLGIDEKLGELIPTWAKDAFGKIVQGVAAGALAGSWVPVLGTAAGALIGGITGALSSIKIDGKSILKGIIDGIFNWNYSNSILQRAKEFFGNAKKNFEERDWGELGKNILLGIINGIYGAMATIVEPIADLLNATINAIRTVFGIHSPATSMEPFGKYILQGIIEGFAGAFSEMPKAIQNFFSNYVKPWFTKEKWKSQIGSIKTALSEKWSDAQSWWNSKPILKEISTKIFDIKSKLQDAWNSAKNWWNNNKPSLSEITAKIKMPHLKVSWDTTGWAAQALQKLGLKGFPNFSVKYYAQGGFPEDGWFRANHGEIMGKFDNGKSVVANNMQITEGISNAVYQGNREMVEVMYQELSETRRQNEILTKILEKEFGITKDDIGRAARSYANDYYKRTGREAYSF